MLPAGFHFQGLKSFARDFPGIRDRDERFFVVNIAMVGRLIAVLKTFYPGPEEFQEAKKRPPAGDLFIMSVFKFFFL